MLMWFIFTISGCVWVGLGHPVSEAFMFQLVGAVLDVAVNVSSCGNDIKKFLAVLIALMGGKSDGDNDSKR